MLNKQWPVIIEPYDDELFSSWVFRLALANGQEPSIFHRHTTGGRNQGWNQDIDVIRNENLIKQYCYKTGISYQQIYKLLLHNLLEKLSVRKKGKTNSRWLIPLNNRRRNLTSPEGIPFCSLCLTQYRYFKQCWRLAATTVCLEHGIYLKEYCQKCKTPVVLRKIYFSFKNCITVDAIVHCAMCGFDLRMSHKYGAKQSSIEHNYFNWTAINNGYINSSYLQIQYSHLYFEAVSVLSCVLFFRKSGVSLFKFIKHKLGLNYQCYHLVSQRMRTIENMPLNSRDVALHMINWCLEDYPHRFNSIVTSSGVMHSALRMTRDYHPFWFNRVFELVKKNI